MADRAALLASIEAVARCAGLRLVDGKPLLDWFEQQRRVELEKFLIRCEDADPELAALLQQQIDESRGPEA